MSVDLELAPKTKRGPGEPCCEPVVYPDVERARAERLAAVAKALGDPIRLQLVDVLRKHAGKVCVCELVPLFDLSQPTVSHHLKILREAPETAHIPVVALSANAMPRDIEKGLQAGFFRYLTKPIKVNEFMQALDAVMDFARQGAGHAK